MNPRIYLEHISRVFSIFDKSKWFIAKLYLCFIGTALLDLLGISLIGPFVLVIFDFDNVQGKYNFLSQIPQDLLSVYFSLCIIAVFLFRSFMVWVVNVFILDSIFNKQVELRGKVMFDLLEQDYSKRLEKTTGHYSRAMFAFTQQFVQSLINIFRIAAEALSILFIIILLIITNVQLFIIALLFTLLALGMTFFFISNRFIRYGEIKNEGQLKFSNAVNDGIFGIKEIKILGLAKFFQKKVVDGATQAASAEKKLYLFSIIPRYFIETIILSIICLILLFTMQTPGDPLSAISELSIFLVACLRLLPSINLVISCFNSINLDIDAIKILYAEFDKSFKSTRDQQNQKEHLNMTSDDEFRELIIRDLTFSYNEDEFIFKSSNLRILKGDFIGLVGKSGGGKTTLIDIMLGIRKPNAGDILYNENSIYSNLESWRSKVAYLPQEIFMINATIAENIALGQSLDEIDLEKVHDALDQAGLSKLIESTPGGVLAEVGERALKFSGGQRQRIALARAFFSGRKIFLFDESTSALDKPSSEKILNKIVNLSKTGATIILISHQEEMLNMCSRKIRIEDAQLHEVT